MRNGPVFYRGNEPIQGRAEGILGGSIHCGGESTERFDPLPRGGFFFNDFLEALAHAVTVSMDDGDEAVFASAATQLIQFVGEAVTRST